MGVAVLPVRGGKVGLLSMYRHPVERDTVELVKGFIDQGETPGDAARRELLEETGCVAVSLVSLGHVTPEASTLASRSALFLALEATEQQPPEDKDIGLGLMRWYDLYEALAMVERSEIQDSYTIICLLRCDRLRRSAGL